MSRIISFSQQAPAVFIGERHQDSVAEAKALRVLEQHFPEVSYVTAPDGEKLIPVTEALKFFEVVEERCGETGKSAYDDGYKAGLDAGLTEARKVMQQFEAAISDAINQRGVLLNEARERILSLVLQISRKVTFDAVEADREATATMINNMIDGLSDRSRLKIRVHPNYLAIVEAQMNRFLQESSDIKDLTFEADPRVKMGGCLIEAPSGDIDARLESQFEIVENVLRNGES